MSEVYDAAALAALEQRVDEWLAELDHEHDHILAVDRGEDDLIRWYVRMQGEEKDFTTAWLTLGQRTLRYETYVMPAPEENDCRLYEHLLRLNQRIVGAHFSIGDEEAIFLRGELPVESLDKEHLDRILGTLYAHVEQNFGTLIRIGFASRFA